MKQWNAQLEKFETLVSAKVATLSSMTALLVGVGIGFVLNALI